MKKLLLYLLLLLTLNIAATLSGNAQNSLRVNTMPSNDDYVMEGNASLGESISLWGTAFGGSPPYNFVLKVDGVPITITETVSETDKYAYNHFAGGSYTFSQAGKHIVRLEATDSNGDTASCESKIRVWIDPIFQIKVYMRIERAFLYLFRTASIDPGDPSQIFWNVTDPTWNSVTTMIYSYGGTTSAILAFEEGGHLGKNNPYKDPYAELVRKGLRYVLSKYSGQMDIPQHSDGIAIRNTDLFQAGGNSGTAGLGKGSYLFRVFDGGCESSNIYANGFGMMAVIMAHHTAQEAQMDTVHSGPFTGWTYYDLIKDAIDMLIWSQGDDYFRGAWYYYLRQNSCLNPCGAANFDGSCQQWPILAMKAAEDKWGISTPVWMKENCINAYEHITCSEGGVGYNNSSSHNVGKTGGLLVFTSWYDTNSLVMTNLQNNAISYIINNVDHCSGGGQDNYGGWSYNFYHMYSLKKGLSLHNIDFLNGRDWYREMVAWLTGEQIGTLFPGFCGDLKDNLHAYGQFADGSWRDNVWITKPAVGTAHAILILLKTVTVPPPIAIIDPIGCSGSSNNCVPLGMPFQLGAGNSFHMGAPSYSITEYQWLFDPVNNPPSETEWYSPDLEGPNPTYPGFTTSGTHHIYLRVLDNHSPDTLKAVEHLVVCADNADHPPVARVIPDSLLPCYTGKPGEVITFSGLQSYDPDGDPIVAFKWDTDGDGQFDDGNTPVINQTYGNLQNNVIGLIVSSVNSGGDTIMSCPDYGCLIISNDDILIETMAYPCIVDSIPWVELHFVFKNNPVSSHTFYHVPVKLFNQNPLTTGNPLNYIHTIDSLVPGGTATWDVMIPMTSSLRTIWAWLDPYQTIDEFDEINNLKSVVIGPFGFDDQATTDEDTPVLTNVLANDDPYAVYTLSLDNILIPPVNGVATIVGTNILYTPNLNFNGWDSLYYVMHVPGGLGGNSNCYDTLKLLIRINPVNDPPLLTIQDIGLCQDDTVSIYLPDVISDIDNNYNQLTVNYQVINASPLPTQINDLQINVNSATNFLNANLLTPQANTIIFEVEIRVTDPLGLTSTDTVTFSFHPLPLVNLGKDTVLCSGQSILLDAGNPGCTYQWQNGTTTPTLTVNQPGYYHVTVSNTYGCDDRDTVSVTYHPSGTITWNGLPGNICENNAPVSLTGGIPAGGTYSGLGVSNNLFDPAAAGIGTITLTYSVVDQFGCLQSVSSPVTVNPNPVAEAGPNVNICLGDTAHFIASGGQNYIWNNGSLLATNAVAPNSTTTYWVTASNSSSCFDIDSVTAIVHPLPVLSIFPSEASICKDSSVVLMVGGANNYHWSPSYNLSSSAGWQVTATPAENTVYHVEGWDNWGCKDNITSVVNVFPSPESHLPDSIFLCEGDQVTLEPGFNHDCWYSWQDGSILTKLVVTKPDIYWVKIFNAGCTLVDSTLVLGCGELWIPNSFTPDGNGTNDIFMAKGIQVEFFEMAIYNRWGGLLFFSHDIENGWDGSYRGEISPGGVYYYEIKYKLNGRKSMLEHGVVNLLR